MRETDFIFPGGAVVTVAEFSLVTIYEDFAACVRASQMVKLLAAQLAPEFGIKGRAWSFESLRPARPRNQAAAQACAADMILISGSAAAELPRHILDWFESWLPHRRSGPAALVALLELDEEFTPAQSLPLRACLRRMAKAANLDFFCNLGEGPSGDFHDRAQYPIQTAEGSPALTGDIFHFPSACAKGASRRQTGRTVTPRAQNN